MKRIVTISILLVLSVVFTVSYAAGKKYKYDVLEDKTIRITGVPYSNKDTLKIPASIDGFKVSSITSESFFNSACRHLVFSEGIKELVGTPQNNYIKEITIPSSMTTINFEKGVIFRNCDSLEKINVHNRNPVYGVENGCLYGKETKELIYYPVSAKTKKIKTPSEVISIRAYAFLGNKYLESLIISEGVTSIGKYAINECEKLRSISLPSSLSLSSWNGENILDCPQMTTITVAKESPYLQVVDGALIDVVNNKLLYMPDNTKITKYVIPETVKDIEKNAFKSCNNLVSVHIPGTVEIVESYAFGNCINLRNVDIDEGVTFISNHAFAECYKLSDPAYPESAELFSRTPDPYATEEDKLYGN